MFSIIIPIYNAAPFLQQCLDSIARQTYTDFEVIMVDDGSTDNSAAICKEMQQRDSHFIYVYKENGGVSSARNLGIDKAKGEWISFVDADDWLADDYLQLFYDTNPKADITFFGKTLFEEDGKEHLKLSDKVFLTVRSDIEKTICKLDLEHPDDVFGWTWDKFFRAKIIKHNKIRFACDVTCREDELFVFEYCRYISTMRVIDKALYYYRIHSGGRSRVGMKHTDFMPYCEKHTKNMAYYSNERLLESMLEIITNYRAKYVFQAPLSLLSVSLRDFYFFINKYPQQGKYYNICHLSQYLMKSYWLGYIYCLIRKI